VNDTMNEITAFSPFGGRLVLEEVKGAQERANVPENSIETKAGDDRSMYVYVPASGCPDAKQTQVVMFLRDGARMRERRTACFGCRRVRQHQGHILLLRQSQILTKNSFQAIFA